MLRRLASTAVVAALAVTGLAACNRAPDVAVYFGDRKAVTETEVERVYDDSAAKLTDNGEGKKVMPIDRQTIVNVEVATAALRELGQRNNFTPAPVPAESIAQQLTMLPTAAFVTLAAQYQGWRTAALQNAKPAEATDADLHDIYDRFKAAGSQGTYEQFAASIDAQAREQIAPPLGLRNDLRTLVGQLKVTVNPRYAAPTLPLLSTQGGNGGTVTLIDIQFGSGAQTAPVIDLA